MQVHEVEKNWFFTSRQTISENASVSDIPKKDDELSKISDSITSDCCKKNMLAAPVSDGYQRKENNPNLLGDTSQSLYETQKGKVLTCKVCKAEISKHKNTYEESFHYDCCICTFNDTDPIKLHSHSFDHVPHQVCNICSKEHTEGDSHDGAKQCCVKLCKEVFKCRTQLREHYLLIHEDFFLHHCWECSKDFTGHSTEEEGKTVYSCCLCEYKALNRDEWKNHKTTHNPKLFCKICKEEHLPHEKGYHHFEFTCNLCNQNFKCKGLFEQHNNHEYYFQFYCRVCNKEISDHETSRESSIFKYCKCNRIEENASSLNIHLYEHPIHHFEFYKCDACEDRFKSRSDLDGHSESCPAVPFKCVGCQAKFPSGEFLDLHCSVKHKML